MLRIEVWWQFVEDSFVGYPSENVKNYSMVAITVWDFCLALICILLTQEWESYCQTKKALHFIGLTWNFPHGGTQQCVY